MSADSRENLPRGQAATVLEKLLGSLELEIMEFMWQAQEATVQRVTEVIDKRRRIAYTTVMTVMGHLVNKGLLTRSREGKRYRYWVARSRQEFLQETSRNMVRALVNDFGDLAIAQFLGEIDEVDAESLQRLSSLARRAGGEEEHASE